MWYNQKRARKSSKRAQFCFFTPNSSKFRAFRTLHPHKHHMFLEFFVENKAFHFSKRALGTGTARNKWLKKVLNCYVYFNCLLLQTWTKYFRQTLVSMSNSAQREKFNFYFSATREANRTFITNNRDLFHLWWKENLVKHEKISKNYDHDCSHKFSGVLKFHVSTKSNK